MHKFLKRQLKRRKLPVEWVKSGEALLNDISDAYQDFENEKIIIERSLELVSEELNERNRVLRSKLALLESTHLKLADSLAIVNSIFDSTGEAIVGFDRNGKLLRCNRLAKKILRIGDNQNNISLDKVLKKVVRDVNEPKILLKQLRKIKRQPLVDSFGVVELRGGGIFEFHSSAQTVEDSLHGRVWCFRNVTEAKKNEKLVHHQAFHDALTDLPNRILLHDRLSQAIHSARRKKSLVAILFIDLDHFKKINDTLGHQQGDQLLIDVSKRIKSCLRGSDTLARLGGDEFVVVLGDIQSHKIASKTSHRIIQMLSQHFMIENNKYYISCSIGVAIYPQDDDSGEELVRKADLAMYHAKEQGRSDFQFFDKALERIAHYNLDLENKLRKAIKEQAFMVYYQPKYSLKDKSIRNVEALLRWRDDERKLISPMEFIPLAEQMGLIIPLGYWVIENVCQQIIIWQNQGISDVIVSINLSPQQFKEVDFIDNVSKLLIQTGVEGKSLDWEITESILLEDLEQVNSILLELKKMGSTISIDDFGTGYSSLQYIQKLPVDTLKIDRSFIVELTENPSEESLVSGIISLAHNLKLEVVAEGVEDVTMVNYLSRKNCDFIQGFYYYKPMDSNALTTIFCEQ